ncbi:hypothetical protein K469DRAFT_500890, partial [Zopfia rhizophila CBS 207.26]
QASKAWSTAHDDINNLMYSSSWRDLVRKGGRKWVNQIAVVFSDVSLNVAQNLIKEME